MHTRTRKKAPNSRCALRLSQSQSQSRKRRASSSSSSSFKASRGGGGGGGGLPSSLTAGEVSYYQKLRGGDIYGNEDFSRVFKEVSAVGSQSFSGYDRKIYKEKCYEEVTGKKFKRPKTPRNILAGMIKKTTKKKETEEKRAKEAGIVTSNTGKSKKRRKKTYSESNRRDSRIAGPSPSIGYVRKGVLKINKS